MTQPESGDVQIPIGNAPPRSVGLLVLFAVFWLGWIAFLVAMVIS